MRELIKILICIFLVAVLIVIFPKAKSPKVSEDLIGCFVNIQKLNNQYSKLSNSTKEMEICQYVCPSGGKYFPRYEKTEFCCDRDGPIDIIKMNLRTIDNPLVSIFDFSFLILFQMPFLLFLLYKINKNQDELEKTKFPITISFYGFLSAASLRNYSIVSGYNMFSFEGFFHAQSFSIILISILYSLLQIKNNGIKLLVSFYSIFLHFIGVIYFYNLTGGT